MRLETDVEMNTSRVRWKGCSGVLEKSWKKSNLGKAASERSPSLDPEADDGITPFTTSCFNWRKKEEDLNVGERM